MARLRHPINGAMYTVLPDGLVEVENNGLVGVFDCDGKHHRGDLTYADPHMLVWLVGPQLGEGIAPGRKHRG